MINRAEQKESVKVLNECIELQLKKSQDYQNPASNVKQAMHYRRGVSTIHDMILQKVYRAQSLIETEERKPPGSYLGPAANFESLEDTFRDIINYCSFAIVFLRKKMDGQRMDCDPYMRPLLETSPEATPFLGHE